MAILSRNQIDLFECLLELECQGQSALYDQGLLLVPSMSVVE